MKNNKSISRKIKLGSYLSIMAVCFCVAIVFMSSMNNVVVNSNGRSGYWSVVRADAVIDDGKSGFVNFSVHPYQSDVSVYDTNLSGGSYEYSDNVAGGELTGTIPNATAFDFYMKVAITYDEGWNITTSQWDDTRVRANITVDFDVQTDVSSNTPMNVTRIYPDAAGTSCGTAYYACYYQNNTGGFTINADEKFNVTDVHLEIFKIV